VIVVDQRLSRLAQKRQQYVRSGPYDLTWNDPDGWVANQVVPVRWGDWPSAGTPAWYLGRDDGGGAYPIGPNGPWVGQESLLPAVTRCTGIIVAAIVRTLWRYTGPDGAAVSRPLWVDDPMGVGRLPGVLRSVVPAGMRLDGQTFFETWLTHALWWGLGAFVYVENSEGAPTAGTLRLLNPYLVGVDDDGYWVIDPRGETPIRTDFDGRFLAGGKVWRLAVLRGMAPADHRTPEGVLARHFDTFRLGAAVSKYVATTFTGMGIPSGLLKVSTPGFKDTDAENLKAQWMKAHGSSRRSVAVLNSTVEYQPISITPVDMGSEAMLRTTRADIAHAFGLSAIWLDEGASGLTYNNGSDRRRDLVDISLSHWSEAAMAVLTSLMPLGTRVEVNWPTFTQPSVEVLSPSLVALVQSGVLTATEARQYLMIQRPIGPDPAFVDTSPATQSTIPTVAVAETTEEVDDAAAE